MNKTLYLRDGDGPIWERARELAGDKLSPVVVGALKRFVAEKEAQALGFERIVVTYRDAEEFNTPKAKAFYGRWIYSLKDPMPFSDEMGAFTTNYSVAVTPKGNVVVYRVDEDAPAETTEHRFFTFKSMAEAMANPMTVDGVRAAIEKQGVPVEELDI
jgi:hypothetical protein